MLEMKQEVEQAGGCLATERVRQYEKMYERLLRYGATYQIFLLQKGSSRTGREEARKLLYRLQVYQAEVLRFFRDPNVPFDTRRNGIYGWPKSSSTFPAVSWRRRCARLLSDAQRHLYHQKAEETHIGYSRAIAGR
ncbi:hypothetical protein [Geobacillus thermoleovorans]|uniref:hypothetical protein n=1 Tax=Geobacillus thermoleovorans TaxID=33941 RepID=UPI003DA35719